MNGPKPELPELPKAGWLWLRWSWRDLRAHWVAVVAIALVMAIGIGVYAGLGSSATWRRESNDASFAAQNMHDLKVTLNPGTFIDEGLLAASLHRLDTGLGITGSDERLVVDSQIDAPAGDESILVAARVVGMNLESETTVDAVWITEGQAVTNGTDSVPVGVLEAKFADDRALPAQGTLTVTGNRRVNYSALGTIPEDFFYEGPEGSVLSAGELAPLYLTLADAQAVTGNPGKVNELVLTVADGADRDGIEARLAAEVDRLGVSAVVSTREDADAVRVLYEDIDNDQRFWNALAGLILIASGLAAFNLISRIVEAQRREIGIGMALGVPKRQLAIRPLLVGIQVAVLGTLAGVGVGLLMGRAVEDLLTSFLPLPRYVTPFQFGIFAQAALLGLVIPIVAAAIPVWRAVRVEPIEAIRTGHLAAKTSRLTDWTGRLRLPGSSLTQMPIRNVLRTPRRTMLTAVGIGAAITALVATLGMLDSFGRTIDQVGDELTTADPDRVQVQLDTFYPTESQTVADVRAKPSVRAVDVGLRLPVIGRGTGEDLDLLVDLVDLQHAIWTPTLTAATATPDSGIILAKKAADDLGVGLGDSLSMRHPLAAEGSFATVESQVTVAGIHASPLRTFAYMDTSNADRFGLAGQTNMLHLYPQSGTSRSEVQRDVFDLPGVTSSQAVARISEGFDEALAQFVGFLFIAAIAVLILALLIAFNATRITVEERRREHATMRAFGFPIRSIMGVVVKESVLIGVAATTIGIGAGLGFLQWMLGSLATTTLPDLGITRYLSPTTIFLALAVGIAAVAIAPLFLIRRIARMDIPDTLRVME